MAFLQLPQARADRAHELLLASDQGRGSLTQGLTWSIHIETVEDGDKSDREFLVKAMADDAFVEATSPARNKGEIYIFNNRDMWFYNPSLKKPVSISSRQRLTGQAANGDIASTHYARDYEPTIEKSEIYNGKKCEVLNLAAKSNNVTYDKIRYWIEEESKLAVRAEFLNSDGKPFKIGELQYSNTVKLNGKTVPFVSQLTITDAKFPQNKSVIHYDNPKIAEHPKSLFNVNNISR
jgi:outer membrane lipoprotein-sorting protein